MISRILSLFRSDSARLRERFLQRFACRTIIVHHGLSIGWVAELMKEAGGGAHFRIDARLLSAKRPTPIEWFVRRHLLAHELPLPLLVKVDGERLLVRHLVRNGMPVHPSEIYWMLGEFPDRRHLELTVSGDGFAMVRGMDVDDNFIDFDAIFADSGEF